MPASRSASTQARALDDADPLGEFQARFVIEDPALVYLDGNSLGRLPRATVARLERLVRDEWGGSLVRGWERWIDEPERVGELIGTTILGARPGETIVSDSTTVNLYKLAVAALDARPSATRPPANSPRRSSSAGWCPTSASPTRSGSGCRP